MALHYAICHPVRKSTNTSILIIQQGILQRLLIRELPDRLMWCGFEPQINKHSCPFKPLAIRYSPVVMLWWIRTTSSFYLLLAFTHSTTHQNKKVIFKQRFYSFDYEQYDKSHHCLRYNLLQCHIVFLYFSASF